MADTAYKIVSHKEAQDTEDEVHALLKEGWELHGDLKVTDHAYVQAMVKREYYGGIDQTISIHELDDVKDALEKIAEAIDDVGTNMAHVAHAIGAHSEDTDQTP
jgi:predicted DNA-binding ArsR family transcriptional regulator